MIVGIVGSRHYRPDELIADLLTALERSNPDALTVVSGGEPTGVDMAVEEACRASGYHFCMEDSDTIGHLTMAFHFAAILPENGSARAKFARNSKVVRHVNEIIALYRGPERSPGTSDTVRKARKAGIPTFEHMNGAWL